MPRIASVNQDSGISPDRSKGAAVHLTAMREAFTRLGCKVTGLDNPDNQALDAALEELQRQFPQELVYERYSLGNATASRFARKHRIPLVLEVNSPLADEQSRYRGKEETPSQRENDHYLFSNASIIAAVSTAVAAYAVQRGADPDRVRVYPNGIDERRFNLSVREKPAPVDNIPPNSFVLGFHGRERPWHGFDKLVETFMELLNMGLPVHLLVIGDGDFTALNGLPENSFTRLGWQSHDKIPGLIANFDVLPLTHQPDAPFYFSPLKLAEAMACGVVPIVPDMGDLSSTVLHGETGYIYPAGDMDRLVKIIRNLCNDSTKREAVSTQSAAFAATISWINIARQIIKALAMPTNEAHPGSD